MRRWARRGIDVWRGTIDLPAVRITNQQKGAAEMDNIQKACRARLLPTPLFCAIHCFHLLPAFVQPLNIEHFREAIIV
jgi:hypothetical protein